MRVSKDPATILLVDDDEVVRQVLSRVLTQEGHTVMCAADPAQALQMAQERQPRLALLDLSLGEGDGVDLAKELHARQENLPMVLMTAYPLRLCDRPEVARLFDTVLTKPLDLERLRETVNASMAGKSAATVELPAARQSVPSKAAFVAPAVAQNGAPTGNHVPSRWAARQSAGIVILALGVLAGFLVYVARVPMPWQADSVEKTVLPPPPLGVELVKGTPHTLAVPEDVRLALGIRNGTRDQVVVAEPPATPRTLVLSGSTDLVPGRLMRIRVQFAPAKVVEKTRVPDEAARLYSGRTEDRELRSGDIVKKGQVLCVLTSVDVGQKKNDLIDALVKLKLDQQILDKTIESSNVLTGLQVMTARSVVEGDRNAVSKALNTLQTWGIPKEDIQAVYTEAEEINKRNGKRDPSKQDQWARVVLRAPEDGVIVEDNCNLHDPINDNTINLFQIANVDRLLVKANAFEGDQLAAIEKLNSSQRRWTVRMVGAEPGEGIVGPIDEIGWLIDPNQHSAVIKGHIQNPGQRLRGGQMVTASIDLPPPEDVVEIPISALVDDGKQCVVFVQPDPKKDQFTLRRVQVTHRFDKSVYVASRLSNTAPAEARDGAAGAVGLSASAEPAVSSTSPAARADLALTPEEKEQGMLPRMPLRRGERVLTAGVLQLKKELEDRESETAQLDKK